MENTLFVMASIAIAAVIGYVTNYLAIKMLFHPREAWRIRGRRVPFTPGLIPKRKGEIAVALGRVVSDYLVTADGLKAMLQQPELRGQVERKLRELVEEWAESGETLEEIAVRLLGQEAAQDAKRVLEQLAGELLASGVKRLWGGRGSEALAESDRDAQSVETGMQRPLTELLDKLQIPLAELVEREGVTRIVQALREELSSANGTRLIRKIVTQMLDGLGGMMGMLAGMFLDEDKIVVKVREAMLSYLNSRAGHEAIAGILLRQTEQLGKLTPAELLGKLREQIERHGWSRDGARESGADALDGKSGVEAQAELKEPANGAAQRLAAQQERPVGAGERMPGGEAQQEPVVQQELPVGAGERLTGGAAQQEPAERQELPVGAGERLTDAEWYAALVGRVVPVRSWMEHLWRMTPRDLLQSRKAWLLEQVPGIADRFVAAAADNIDQAVRAVNLPKLVQEQVENFPIEQVEQVILSITGREFKAITWLGALLGGLIGIVQALLYIWIGS